MTLRCFELKGQIEQAKARVVEERMKQQVCRDEIAHLKEATAPGRSSSKENIRNDVHSCLGLKFRRQPTACLRLLGPSFPDPARNALVPPSSRRWCVI